MTFLAPLFLALAAAAAGAVVLLHFLARRRPPAAPLPTTRFVPERAIRATSRAPRPTDLLLLALRVLLVLLVGAAFAGPVREPARRAAARVLLVERSRAAASAPALRDSALARWRRGDVVVLVDSAVRVVEGDAGADSLRALAPVPVRGALTAGLVAAQRAAARLAAVADSVSIVVVSPLVAESVDSATGGVRRAWGGALRVVRVAAREPDAAPRIAVRAPPDDPVAASVALLGLAAPPDTEPTVRLVRGAGTAADDAWAAAGASRVLVLWPPDGAGLDRRDAADTIGAVAAPGALVVAPFVRTHAPGAGRAVARWADGEPAAAERATGAGCRRAVAIPVSARGDLALRAEMLALVRALAAPCGGEADLAPAPDSVVAALEAGSAPRGDGPDADTPARMRAGPAVRSTIAPWLLAAALLLALSEPLLRREDRSREARS